VSGLFKKMGQIKILYTTDWHLCSRCPGKRSQDNFFSLQMAKVDEIIKTAIDNQVTAIIHGGDFFDSPKIDYWLLNIMISKFNLLKEAGIAVCLVPGSHDMYGYNVSSIPSTAVGALKETGLLTILEGSFLWYGINILAVPATLEHTLKSYDALIEGQVVISHNLVTPTSVPYDHILLQNLPGNKIVYLLGHYHKYFICKVNDNVFVNTGPLIRTDISEQDHAPCAALLTFEDSKIKSIKKLALTSAKNNVFVKESVEQKPLDFVDSIRNTTFQYCDLFDLTKQIAASVNTPKEIVANALARLEKVQREIS